MHSADSREASPASTCRDLCALLERGGNCEVAAKILGISRKSLCQRVRGLVPEKKATPPKKAAPKAAEGGPGDPVLLRDINTRDRSFYRKGAKVKRVVWYMEGPEDICRVVLANGASFRTSTSLLWMTVSGYKPRFESHDRSPAPRIPVVQGMRDSAARYATTRWPLEHPVTGERTTEWQLAYQTYLDRVTRADHCESQAFAN